MSSRAMFLIDLQASMLQLHIDRPGRPGQNALRQYIRAGQLEPDVIS